MKAKTKKVIIYTAILIVFGVVGVFVYHKITGTKKATDKEIDDLITAGKNADDEIFLDADIESIKESFAGRLTQKVVVGLTDAYKRLVNAALSEKEAIELEIANLKKELLKK